jgi:hypothetical protein
VTFRIFANDRGKIRGVLDFIFRNTTGAGNVTLNVAAVGARVYTV